MFYTRLVVAVAVLAANCLGSLVSLSTPGPDVSNTVQAATRVLEMSNTGTESGCISWNGAADVSGASACGTGFAGGNEGPQSQTRTAGALGIVNGADLRIVFDAVEPNGNGITLSALRLLVLNPTTGALIFSADLDTALVLASTLEGTGKSDALLGLDAIQAAAFDTAISGSGVALANVRIGLNATATSAAGGPEALYVGSKKDLDPSAAVPEPATYLLTAVGLLGLGMLRRQR